MIIPETRFLVARVPLRRIVVMMCELRYPERVLAYHQRLTENVQAAGEDVLIHLAPLPHGYYTVLDGHHRFLASLMAGRADILALVVVEPGQPGYEQAAQVVMLPLLQQQPLTLLSDEDTSQQERAS